MQDGRKAVWSIPYVSVAFFPSLKHNFIAYCSSKVSSGPECIFEIDQLWQSGFSRVYSNCCCNCWFEPEIIKISFFLSHLRSSLLSFFLSFFLFHLCSPPSFFLSFFSTDVLPRLSFFLSFFLLSFVSLFISPLFFFLPSSFIDPIAIFSFFFLFSFFSFFLFSTTFVASNSFYILFLPSFFPFVFPVNRSPSPP